MFTFVDRIRHANLPALCASLAAVSLGHALQIHDGFYHPAALGWTTVALGLCTIGVVAHRFTEGGSPGSARLLSTVLIAGIA